MPERPPLETTAALIHRIHAGDAAARDQLAARFLPILRSWAHGRLPLRARGMADTDDLVQVTLYRALNRVEAFEPRHDGAFLAYLRQSLINALRQEVRRATRKPSVETQAEEAEDRSASVVEQVIGRETLERYEAALLELTEDQREAALLRLEFGFSYPEIAEAMGKPSANAARMLVVRALVRLAELMHERTD